MNLRTTINNYIKIFRYIQNKPVEWNDYFSSPDIINIQPPDEISHFNKLVLTIIFRPELKLFAIEKYIKEDLGENFIKKKISKLDDIYGNMT